jgi:putative ABC transport system permease protein
VSSALLVRTVFNMVSTPIGVDADDVVTTSVQVSMGDGRNFGFIQPAGWRKIADAHELIVQDIRQRPGVSAVGAASVLPVDIGWRLPFEVEGDDVPVRTDDRRITQYQMVSDGYFETMHAPMAAGRPFSTFDTADAPPVAIVNETFANRYLVGRPAVGRVVVAAVRTIGPSAFNLMEPPGPINQPPRARGFEVIGVVKDIRNTPLGQPIEPTVYLSSQQFPVGEMLYAIRANGAGNAISALRATLAKVAPTVPIGITRTWGDRMASRSAEQRLLMTMLIFFGAAAALLAALGVYGLFSWSVAQRTRELAIRLTLGAKPVSVGASVVRQSLALVAIGLVVGLAIVRISEATLARVLFEMSPRDPGSLAAAGMLLLVVALAACVPPAIRALRVDPVEGLRSE